MPTSGRDDRLMQGLEAALPGVLAGLKRNHFERYAFLRARLKATDVSQDSEFQRVFTGLYRVRRDAAWRGHYFRLMEAEKGKPPCFPPVLAAIHLHTGRVEASFASKLVAIIHPAQAVYDSVVAANLGLAVPKLYDPPLYRLAMFAETYQVLNQRMNGLIQHPSFPGLKQRLAAAFPIESLTDVRVLDLLLWQLRP